MAHQHVVPETHYLKVHLFQPSASFQAALGLCFVLPPLWPDGAKWLSGIGFGMLSKAVRQQLDFCFYRLK